MHKLIHPDYTQGIAEALLSAREFYKGRKAAFTGPDGRTRPAVVLSTIFNEDLSGKYVVMVHLNMGRLDGSPDALEADWVRSYWTVADPRINWDVEQ